MGYDVDGDEDFFEDILLPSNTYFVDDKKCEIINLDKLAETVNEFLNGIR